MLIPYTSKPFEELILKNIKIIGVHWDSLSRKSLLHVLRQNPEAVSRQPELMVWLARDDVYRLEDLQFTGLVIGRITSDDTNSIQVHEFRMHV